MTEISLTMTARVFFALWPKKEEENTLALWQMPLQKVCGGSLMTAGRLHCTLVFLGNVQVERLEALMLAAQEVCGVAFQLKFDIARYWGHNHIVYAAPGTVPDKLTQLVSNLEQKLHRHHFNFEQRSYKPHVTLLRHAQWKDEPLPVMLPVTWRIGDFALVQSISEGQVVRYEVLARFHL